MPDGISLVWREVWLSTGSSQDQSNVLASCELRNASPVLRRQHPRRCGLTSGSIAGTTTGTPSHLAHHWASGSTPTSRSAQISATFSSSPVMSPSSCSTSGVTTTSCKAMTADNTDRPGPLNQSRSRTPDQSAIQTLSQSNQAKCLTSLPTSPKRSSDHFAMSSANVALTKLYPTCSNPYDY